MAHAFPPHPSTYQDEPVSGRKPVGIRAGPNVTFHYSRDELLSFKEHATCQKLPEDLTDLDPLISRDVAENSEKSAANGVGRAAPRRDWNEDGCPPEEGAYPEVQRPSEGWRPPFSRPDTEPILGAAPRSWDRPSWAGPGGPRGPHPPGGGRGPGPLAGPGSGRWDYRSGPGLSPRFRDGDGEGSFAESPPRVPRRTSSGPLRPGWGPETAPGIKNPPPGFTTHGFRQPHGPQHRGPPNHMPLRPLGESQEDTFNRETFGYVGPPMTDRQREEEERKRREEFEAMRQEHKRRTQDEPATDNEAKKHDEDGIWDNISRDEERAPSKAGASNVRTLPWQQNIAASLRPQIAKVPPGFSRLAAMPMDQPPKPGPDAPATPQQVEEKRQVSDTAQPDKSSDNNHKDAVKEKQAGGPSLGQTASEKQEGLAISKDDGPGHQKPVKSSSETPLETDAIKETLFEDVKQEIDRPASKIALCPEDSEASLGNQKGKAEADAVALPDGIKTGSLPKENMLEKLFLSASGLGSRAFPGLGDEDKVLTSAVLEDMWAPEPSEDDHSAQSRFARWFNKAEGAESTKVIPTEPKGHSLLSLLEPLPEKATAAHPPSTPPPAPLEAPEPKVVPQGPSLEEIEAALAAEAGQPKAGTPATLREKTEEPPKAEAIPQKQAKSAGLPPGSTVPVFMTLEDIEKALVGPASSPRESEKVSTPTASNTAGQQLLALLQKGGGSTQGHAPGGNHRVFGNGALTEEELLAGLDELAEDKKAPPTPPTPIWPPKKAAPASKDTTEDLKAPADFAGGLLAELLGPLDRDRQLAPQKRPAEMHLTDKQPPGLRADVAKPVLLGTPGMELDKRAPPQAPHMPPPPLHPPVRPPYGNHYMGPPPHSASAPGYPPSGFVPLHFNQYNAQMQFPHAVPLPPQYFQQPGPRGYPGPPAQHHQVHPFLQQGPRHLPQGNKFPNAQFHLGPQQGHPSIVPLPGQPGAPGVGEQWFHDLASRGQMGMRPPNQPGLEAWAGGDVWQR